MISVIDHSDLNDDVRHLRVGLVKALSRRARTQSCRPKARAAAEPPVQRLRCRVSASHRLHGNNDIQVARLRWAPRSASPAARSPPPSRRPASAGPPSALDQPVVAPAAEHGALRAQPVGDEFERGVAVIVEPAHQPGVARPRDARGVEPGGHRVEEIARLARSGTRRSRARCRRSGGRAGPCDRGCAAGSCRAARGCPRTARRDAPRNARPAPRASLARLGVAQRVELQRHAVGNARVRSAAGPPSPAVRHRPRARPRRSLRRRAGGTGDSGPFAGARSGTPGRASRA